MTNCRVRFITDPFTQELRVQVKMQFSAHPRWDYWEWTSGIAHMAKVSTARPRIYKLALC